MEGRDRMNVDLQNQVALVTGGANGIGRAIVQALAENGASVVIVDLDAAAGERAAAEIEAIGARALSLVGDVADLTRMEQVAAEVVERWGRIDILINNAGINTGGNRVTIEQFSLED